MEFLDKLIPLAILGVVAAFLVVVARRVAREKETPPRIEDVAEPTETPAVVAAVPIAEVSIPTEAPLARSASKEDDPCLRSGLVTEAGITSPLPDGRGSVVQANTKVKRRRARKEQAAVVTVTSAQTPIETVLGLLTEKDALAIAFLLREILGPPVSRRR